MSQILIFGDSITYGASDLEGGWVSRLRKYVDQKGLTDPDYYNLVYNLGISGNNTTDLLKRFEFEVQQRIKEEGETVIIFLIGTNDSQLFKGKFRTEPVQFENNLQQLYVLAQKYSQKVIFVGLFPIDESKTSPVAWHKEKFYKIENIKNNNDTIRKFCEKNGLLFIEIFENFINQDYKSLLDDGIHPTTLGHEKMFEIIKNDLIKNKII
ncbi:MAG: GDSL-type esterase/lipase family protein [Candidatus Parcubacteria bacterium]|nr:GDSL-type esterase/lipase family protein [Candidatus Parcubacteria bacterium]